MKAFDEIQKTVLSLALEQRVSLAESLLASLPSSGDELSDSEEFDLAELRDREIVRGKVKPLTAEEFVRRAQSKRMQ
jgi:hypothetical protein